MLDSEGWVVADESVGVMETTYTIRRLLPARSYQFRVSAVNDVGEGPGSHPSESITLPQQRKGIHVTCPKLLHLGSFV